MSEELLDQLRIQTLVSQHVPGDVTEHVGMNVEFHPSGSSRLADNPGNHVCADRSAPLADEHEWTIADLPQLPQSGNFVAIERMGTVF